MGQFGGELIKATSCHPRAWLILVLLMVSAAGFSQLNAVKIGDPYQGGIVFYLDGKGGGLVAAPADQGGDCTWHNGSFIATGAAAMDIGTGNDNTAKIVAKQGGGNYAAYLCAELILDGYQDWYLPSKDELDLMYRNLKVAGRAGFASAVYWSSSEDSIPDSLSGSSRSLAWAQNFGTGMQDGDCGKYEKHRVRAVRAF